MTRLSYLTFDSNVVVCTLCVSYYSMYGSVERAKNESHFNLGTLAIDAAVPYINIYAVCIIVRVVYTRARACIQRTVCKY